MSEDVKSKLKNIERKDALYEPLPDEAISDHPTKPYLNTINAIYVSDRLNDVFGIDGWTFTTEVIEIKGAMVVVRVVLDCGDVRREQFGGNNNADLGDAYKGAVTDAFTKCASMMGVGVGVWKNEYKKGNKKQQNSDKSPKTAPNKQDNTQSINSDLFPVKKGSNAGKTWDIVDTKSLIWAYENLDKYKDRAAEEINRRWKLRAADGQRNLEHWINRHKEFLYNNMDFLMEVDNDLIDKVYNVGVSEAQEPSSNGGDDYADIRG